MAGIEDLRSDRLRKLALLREAGKNPYPSRTRRDTEIADILPSFDTLCEGSKEFNIAGRIIGKREHGDSVFADIYDGSGKLQLHLDVAKLGRKEFDLFVEAMDMGDFAEANGTLFRTKRGEPSLSVLSWNVLSKSLLPLPEKYHGLSDAEERFRKRYLDILGDPDLGKLFQKKARFWDTARSFLKKRGFLEVETPTLELTTGGAEARPFMTHHNDFDMDVYLRISVGELWQKRLMSAGFPRTFEIGRVYRNEGSSPEHLQEFTNLEFYMGYASYEDGMTMVEEMYRTIALEVFGTTVFESKGHSFDLAADWIRIDYRSEVLRQTGIDVISATENEIIKKLGELRVNYEAKNRERLVDSLWKHCRKSISGPAFLVHHPKFLAPLSKSRPDDPETTEKFQPIIAGTEVGTGYSELNDPLDQRARFQIQQRLLQDGDEEAMMPDWEFVEMLEHGMPPTCGYGFGERLFSLLAGLPIRDTQLFPLMRPKV
ncbi:MAG: hypothetical protein COV07_03010 [Candidatus Vogelbacteria bacterium CG10_big_fil_rev_8_21_14_0_10_45_14]|uniref:Aminoacyl-transfer RNA synthetases class-II family profile domain-containing protein n=1 Tax=Candidatus Vogelbacteria bacterium CG10_big_fil_rev_8_21_14_0_10_45_14 TaxID=1975042 RepID=A0A2H0RJL5_9BACT|nr:MAG: hypothetical protein COV07_03010 [Candidatus Vogelbacteria bacterium CG10_big_fil_rev_8_21_14_0_10_45_14]